MIESIIIGSLAACLTIFINYCIGKPGGEFSPYEIFSGYTVWLSKRRLKKVGLFWQYWDQFKDNEQRNETHAGLITLKNDFNKILYEAADPFFTWERAAGMCSVCSGVWISIIVGCCFSQNIFELIVIVITCHIIIRILNKII